MANDKWPRKVISGSVTVKVYRVKHATNASGFAYVVAYNGPSGRKLEKFASDKEALGEARLKADQLAAGRIEGGEMSRGDRDELQAARQLAGDVPLITAVEEWVKARALTQGHVIAAAEAWASRNSSACERILGKDAVSQFLAAKRKQGVDTTASYEKVFPHFVRKYGERWLDTLSTKELQIWLDDSFPHPSTRNTVRIRIRTLWDWARKSNHIPVGLEKVVEDVDTAQEEDSEIGVITSGVFSQLLQIMRENHTRYIPALVAMGFCGLRRAEVHKQIWEDIFLQRKFLRVTKAKKRTAARRLVPLCDAAVEWLMLCRDRKGPICDNLAVDRIREIGRVSGLTLPENCFRHSFISHRVAQTGNIAETSLEAGNSPKVLIKHYRELFTKEEGESWFRIRPGDTNNIISITA